MRALELTRGKQAIVDDQDFLILDQFNWCLSDRQYAVRGVRTKKTLIRVYLQRVVAQAREGERVNFVDGDTLNCRIGNLVLSGGVRAEERRAGHDIGWSPVIHGSIRWNVKSLRWRARYGEKILGLYESDFDAVEAYNRVIYADSSDIVHTIQTFGWIPPKKGKLPKKIRGVRQRSRNCWEATAMLAGQRRRLGYFPTQRAAANARKAFEKKYDRRGP